MTKEPVMESAEEIAKGLPFDRGPGHQDAEPAHEYYPEAHVCIDCTEKEIAKALESYAAAKVNEAVSKRLDWERENIPKIRESALDEAAQVADRYHDQNFLFTGGIQSPAQSIAERIRALKSMEPS